MAFADTSLPLTVSASTHLTGNFTRRFYQHVGAGFLGRAVGKFVGLIVLVHFFNVQVSVLAALMAYGLAYGLAWKEQCGLLHTNTPRAIPLRPTG